MSLGHTVTLQTCWRFQLALCPVPQCPSVSAPPLPSPNHQGGPFRAMEQEASLWPCGGGGGGEGWCLGKEEQMGCGLVSPAGVSQAWRERGVAAGPQLPVLKTLGKDSLCLRQERMTSSPIQEAQDPQAGAQMGREGVCTVSQCGHLPGVWHGARKSPGPGRMLVPP